MDVILLPVLYNHVIRTKEVTNVVLRFLWYIIYICNLFFFKTGKIVKLSLFTGLGFATDSSLI